jgi:hypothetical protein
MRRAVAEKPQWVGTKEGLIGIQLGADFTAEHEWGIKDMKRSLGIMSKEDADKKKVFGSKRFKVSGVNPDHFLFRETKTTHEAILIFNPRTFGSSYHAPHVREDREKMSMDDMARHYEIDIHKPWREDQEPETLACAWDGGSFGIHVKGSKEQHEWLRELYQALLDGDMIVFLGKRPIPAFSNSSLTLVIASRIPEEGEEVMAEAHREQWELERDAKKCGIAKKLEKAGIRYYALSPRKGIPNHKTSKYDFGFWLNPMEQDKNNFGWFTVEELEAWIKGKGPVPKETANA